MGGDEAAKEPRDGGAALTAGAVRTLAGVRVGLVGFDAADAERLTRALELVQAFVRVVPAAEVQPGSFLLRRLDLLVLALSPALAGTGWHAQQVAAANDRPLVLVGAPAELLAAGEELGGQVRDFLTLPLREDELLLRACRILEDAPRETA